MLQGIHSKPLTQSKRGVSDTTSKIITQKENSYQALPLNQSTSSDQFIRTQPPIKFSGKNINSKSMQTDKNKKVFLTTEQTTLKTDIDEKNEELRPYIEAANKRGDKVENGGVIASALAGAGAGGSYGSAIDVATGGATLGGGALAGGTLGALYGTDFWRDPSKCS